MTIPKKLHQIWIQGEENIPEKLKKYQQGWSSYRSKGWQYKVWDENAIKKILTPKLLDMYNRSLTNAGKSDIARIAIIYSEGGFYVDFDFESLNDITDMLYNYDFIAGYEANYGGQINNALFGAVPRHRILKEVIEHWESHPYDPYQSPVDSTGPVVFTKVINKYLDDPKIMIYPREILYPYGYWEPNRRGEHFPNAYAVHHWDKSWGMEFFSHTVKKYMPCIVIILLIIIILWYYRRRLF